MHRDLAELGEDLRTARLIAGLTLREVAQRVGCAPSVVLGVERGAEPGPRPDRLAMHAAAVGMRARVRVYPEGEPLRDAGQVRMWTSFRSRLPVGLAIKVEQAVTGDPADRRAFDAVLMLPGCRCAIELITRLHDCQAQLRQLHLKQRDGQTDCLIVVLRDSEHNRRALKAVRELLRDAFPLDTRVAMAALSRGRDPGANAIVFI